MICATKNLEKSRPAFSRRLLDNLQRIDGVLRRADRVEYHAVADLAREPQTRRYAVAGT